MIYEVDDKEFTSIDEVIDYCIDDEYHSDDGDFEGWVNDNYYGVDIFGDHYYPYDIVEALNSYAFGELRDRYCEEMNDADREQAEYDLHSAHPGDYVDIQGYSVLVKDGDKVDDEIIENATIESLRERLAEKEKLRQQEASEEEKTENDIMSLIGG